MPVSAAKRRANRANARKSTGPKSEEGKARSSRNATTHGFYCDDLVLKGESHWIFHAMRHALLLRLNPQDTAELLLADRVVICAWKLRRLQESEWYLNECEINESSELYLKEQQRREFHGEPPMPVQPQVMPPAAMVARQLRNEKLCSFERVILLEQRLQNMIHRAMRELRLMQKKGKDDEPRPWCPFIPPDELAQLRGQVPWEENPPYPCGDDESGEVEDENEQCQSPNDDSTELVEVQQCPNDQAPRESLICENEATNSSNVAQVTSDSEVVKQCGVELIPAPTARCGPITGDDRHPRSDSRSGR